MWHSLFSSLATTKLLSYEIIIVFDCGNTDYWLVIGRIRMERRWLDPHIAGDCGDITVSGLYPSGQYRLAWQTEYFGEKAGLGSAFQFF